MATDRYLAAVVDAVRDWTSPVKDVHEHPIAKGFYWIEIEADLNTWLLWLQAERTTRQTVSGNGDT